MEKYLTPNEERFFGETDSETIQNAIAAACEEGSRAILIPRYNARRDNTEWRIPKAIRIPSDFTVYLDNCYMVQETGCFDNMFANWKLEEDFNKVTANEDKNIAVIGIGNAVLSGGVHNGLLEKTNGKFGYPSLYANNMFLWVNVNGLRVENLHIEHHRWWAMCHIYSRNVEIKNINFNVIPHVVNLDGIDLRSGCNNFRIENITGRTGDDTVAMTALSPYGGRLHVSDKDMDIHDIKIRNVKSDPINWFNIRILNHNGIKEYNIDIDTVMDVSDYREKTRGVPQCAIGIGSPLYFSKCPNAFGDTHHITAKNITSRGKNALLIWRTLKDSKFTNIKTYGDNEGGFRASKAEYENVTVEKLWYGRYQQEICCSKDLQKESYTGKAISFGKECQGEITFKDVYVDKVGKEFDNDATSTIKINVENYHCNSSKKFGDIGGTKLIIDGKEVK